MNMDTIYMLVSVDAPSNIVLLVRNSVFRTSCIFANAATPMNSKMFYGPAHLIFILKRVKSLKVPLQGDRYLISKCGAQTDFEN